MVSYAARSTVQGLKEIKTMEAPGEARSNQGSDPREGSEDRLEAASHSCASDPILRERESMRVTESLDLIGCCL